MAVSWLKKGNESVAAAKQEAVAAEARKEGQGKMFRFWLKEKEEASITFVDGDLSPEGFLIPPRYFEHNLFLDGKYGNIYVCPQKTAPHLGEICPICEAGDKPALVSLFTVIDHREFKSNDGTKTYKDRPKLFVAKSGTMEILNKIAVKRGGLAGATFDVMRIGEKSPAVGTQFDFMSKTSVEELMQKYMAEITDPKTNSKTKVSLFVPADYEKEIVYRTAEELVKLGFGAPQVSGYGATHAHSQASNQGSSESTDYSSQL